MVEGLFEPPNVGASDSIAVPSMFVVSGIDPGVASVKTPQAYSVPESVFVQVVCVGPVTGPSWKLDPYEVEPVQVAAVVPASWQFKLAVLSRVSVGLLLNEWRDTGQGLLTCCPSIDSPYLSVLGPSAEHKGQVTLSISHD